jgi:DNA-binding NarL/FixJ family response regulator
MTKIILGDNQTIFRAGIARVLASKEDFRVAAQCSDIARLVLAVDTYGSSIVVFASSLRPEMTEFMGRIKAAHSRAVVIAEEGEAASSYTAQGVRGVIYRNTTTAALVDCVQKVIQGIACVQACADAGRAEDGDAVGARVRDRLTPKEMKIVGLIVQGRRNKGIAERVGTTEQVIKNYLSSIYVKVGVSDRLELALFTINHRLLAAKAAEAVSVLQSQPSSSPLAQAASVSRHHAAV